ncbi:MAG: hypothetical protein WBA57_25020 [Elainellaceae cyanobacterium]
MKFGPGFVSTFLYYFVCTSFATSFVAAKVLNLGFSTGFPQQIGLLLGLFAGLMGGYFNRTTSFSIAFSERQKFLDLLEETLQDMGYSQSREDDDGVLVYERSPIRKLFSGKMFVKLESGEATIASRFIHTSSIRRRLQ